MARFSRELSGAEKLVLTRREAERRMAEFAERERMVSIEKEANLRRLLKDVASHGMRELLSLQRETERARKIQENSLVMLENLMQRAKNQAAALTRALFESDRNLARALNAAHQAAADQEGETQFTYQGQTFTLDQLDPGKVIKQRDLTRQEQVALAQVSENANAISVQLKSLVASLTNELRLLARFKKTAGNLVVQLGLYAGKMDIRSEGFAKAKREIDELGRAHQNASSVESELQKLRRKAIQALKLSEKTAKIVSRVSNRTDIEGVLIMAGGGGLLIAVLAGLTIGSVAAGLVALPALLAVGVSRIISLIRAFRG